MNENTPPDPESGGAQGAARLPRPAGPAVGASGGCEVYLRRFVWVSFLSEPTTVSWPLHVGACGGRLL
jgi:hypothetical protein